MNWELRTIKVKDLIEWSGNPRKISREDLDNLKQSFVEFGHARTLTVAPEGKKFVIIGGNQSLKALKELDFKEIQCSVADREMSEAEKQKLSVILNHRTKGEGEWDYDVLNSWDVDFEDWGIEQIKFETEIHEAKEDDYEIPSEIETDIVLGDLFEIGEHRLLCGDSTDSDSVAKLMNGEKADMVFTDPPYALFGNSTGVANVVDDNMVRPFFKNIMKMCQNNTKLFGHIYMCCDWHSAFSIQSCAREVDLKAKNMCIWDKGDGGVGAMYQQCYEIVWFFDNSPTSKQTMGKTKAGVITVNGVPNIWRFSRVTSDREHNAQKPIEMISVPISNGTKEYELVLDLFLGSGSTMVASHQLKRKCNGMELDPKYCQVILDRMQKLDPNIEIKKNGKPYKRK